MNEFLHEGHVIIKEQATSLAPYRKSNITFEQAAAVPNSAIIVLMNLRDKARPKPGQRVLINGAAGGVGTFAVQIAKSCGAEVTGVDSTEKLERLRSIGADQVIDYTREDFTKSSDRYDLIIDIPGNHSFTDCRRVLTPDGTYVLIGHDHYGQTGRHFLGSIPHFLKLMMLSKFVNQLSTINFSTPSKKELMVVLKELLEAGKLTPVIDRTFPLSEVPEAIRYLTEGNVKGKVVITVKHYNRD